MVYKASCFPWHRMQNVSLCLLFFSSNQSNDIFLRFNAKKGAWELVVTPQKEANQIQPHFKVRLLLIESFVIISYHWLPSYHTCISFIHWQKCQYISSCIHFYLVIIFFSSEENVSYDMVYSGADHLLLCAVWRKTLTLSGLSGRFFLVIIFFSTWIIILNLTSYNNYVSQSFNIDLKPRVV